MSLPIVGSRGPDCKRQLPGSGTRQKSWARKLPACGATPKRLPLLGAGRQIGHVRGRRLLQHPAGGGSRSRPRGSRAQPVSSRPWPKQPMSTGHSCAAAARSCSSRASCAGFRPSCQAAALLAAVQAARHVSPTALHVRTGTPRRAQWCRSAGWFARADG